MNASSQLISFEQTGFFSAMVCNYINGSADLQPFYRHPVSTAGFKSAIAARQQFATNRNLLVQVFQQQYEQVTLTPTQERNLSLLSQEDTFTITTAHQPNLFTGYLYFVYKILHAVQLAARLKEEMPEYNFVPVYYMGSEDADLDELGHVFIRGEKYAWSTKQTGAVGRMKVDAALLQLLEVLGGQLLVHPFGASLLQQLKDCYSLGTSIEQATFKFVNGLFAKYGLLILLPDNPTLKAAYIPVMQKELQEAFSHSIVTETVSRFSDRYKIQASGRLHNLFYLKENIRERIEQTSDGWMVVNTTIRFTHEGILQELQQHPERFSPNVILRPAFQCTILPDIAFIGGGGELAYWMELADVFDAIQVPYPVLVVRNSYLFISKELHELQQKLDLNQSDLFKPTLTLVNELVKKQSEHQLDLNQEIDQLKALYAQLECTAGKIDKSLCRHVLSLQTQAIQRLQGLQIKMLRAEKRKFEAQQRQINKLKTQLFPNDGLQERVSNILLFYANWGPDFIDLLLQHAPAYDQKLVILTEQ